MTPHNEAKKEDIAKIVLMPGDPKRAKFIAENYLTDYRLVNDVRGMSAYTGYYKGKRLTVMGCGMGIPSMGIYSYELFKFYDVDVIIKIGSTGAIIKDLNLYDIIIVDESYSESSFALVQNNTTSNIMSSSPDITNIIEQSANHLNIKYNKGRIWTSDVFYQEHSDIERVAKELNCISKEMEIFALFHNANVCHKKAAAILTVSDNMVTGEETSALERERSLQTMMTLALESVLKM